MLMIRKVDASTIANEKLADAILALDRITMRTILEEAGIEFPEKKRRKGLHNPSTLVILLLDQGKIVGYVEFCRDFNCDKDIYIGSIQLLAKYRTGLGFAVLLVECARELTQHSFRFLKTNVQKNNHRQIRLLKKLGFKLSERPKADATLNATASRKLLDCPLIRKFEKALAGKYIREEN